MQKGGADPRNEINQGYYDTDVWSNTLNAFFYELKTILRVRDPKNINAIFYAPLEKDLKDFLPQLKKETGIDVNFINSAEELSDDKRNNIKIQIIPGHGITDWVNDTPIFRARGDAIIEGNPKLRSDALSFDTHSPFLYGYLYFDQAHNIEYAVCEMWAYMKPSDRQEAIRECIVRALGIVGEIKA